MHAHLLLINGHIITLARPARVEALAVVGERVVAVGSTDEMISLQGPRTRVVDLGGRFAVPGLTDSHVHIAALAEHLRELDLSNATTLAGALRRVGARARRIPRGRWITGGRFDKNLWGEAFPTRHDLDRVAPDHPVVLSTKDGHTRWLNSLALKRCGITASTKSPAGGEIQRDNHGRPTGILFENALGLVYRAPAFCRREQAPLDLEKAMRHLVRQGVTSVHAMEGPDTLGRLQEIRKQGRLPLRVAAYLPPGAIPSLAAAGLRSGFGDEWLRLVGIKLFVDGTLGSQTAWLWEPYDNLRPSSRGIATISVRELRRQVREVATAALPCAVHAIGDRAVSEVLDVFSAVGDRRPPLPHRIEHIELVRPEDIGRFAAQSVAASMQPIHIPGDIAPAERYWGKRARYAYPIGSLLRSGALVAFGSDAPVETADPLAGMRAAVLRQSWDGKPAEGWYRQQHGISALEALRCYTTGPAAITGEARLKGRLAPGYLADMVVLSDDITRLRGLRQARVTMVVIGGKVAFRGRGH